MFQSSLYAFSDSEMTLEAFLLFQTLFQLIAGMEDDSVLLVLGGAKKIFLSDEKQSSVTAGFELLGCKNQIKQLPDFPVEVFGANLAWDGEHTLWACGGSNWQGVLQDCYSWDVRYIFYCENL